MNPTLLTTLTLCIMLATSCEQHSSSTETKPKDMSHLTSDDNRIWFPGNPWPEGHPIKDFEWTAEVRNGKIWFHLHLETQDYDAERNFDDDQKDYDSDWQAPIAWNNYHACTISSTNWHNGGFPFCLLDDYSAESLDGYIAEVDPLPIDPKADLNDLAFHTYLLGHDSVAGHRIQFDRRGSTDRFDIIWTGKIALVYAGDYEYRYDFKAQILDVELPKPINSD